MARQKNKDTQKQTVNLEGSRLINIDQLQKYTAELNRHAMQCQGSIVLSGEVRNGLASVLSGSALPVNTPSNSRHRRK